jgi:hypothetical protein
MSTTRKIVLASVLAVLLLVAGCMWLFWQRQCGVEPFTGTGARECVEYPAAILDPANPFSEVAKLLHECYKTFTGYIR